MLRLHPGLEYDPGPPLLLHLHRFHAAPAALRAVVLHETFLAYYYCHCPPPDDMARGTAQSAEARRTIGDRRWQLRGKRWRFSMETRHGSEMAPGSIEAEGISHPVA